MPVIVPLVFFSSHHLPFLPFLLSLCSLWLYVYVVSNWTMVQRNIGCDAPSPSELRSDTGLPMGVMPASGLNEGSQLLATCGEVSNDVANIKLTLNDVAVHPRDDRTEPNVMPNLSQHRTGLVMPQSENGPSNMAM
jgi:hypothetical protein